MQLRPGRAAPPLHPHPGQPAGEDGAQQQQDGDVAEHQGGSGAGLQAEGEPRARMMNVDRLTTSASAASTNVIVLLTRIRPRCDSAAAQKRTGGDSSGADLQDAWVRTSVAVVGSGRRSAAPEPCGDVGVHRCIAQMPRCRSVGLLGFVRLGWLVQGSSGREDVHRVRMPRRPDHASTTLCDGSLQRCWRFVPPLPSLSRTIGPGGHAVSGGH